MNGIIGAFIIEYCGEVMSSNMCMERMNTIYSENKNFYFLNYDNGEVIDACKRGNEARFVNVSGANDDIDTSN
jgi:SET domain-containing protein